MPITALPRERHPLVEDNMGLVHACCRRLSGRGIEYDELFAAGSLGLCKAASGFDPELGYRFSTYAVPVILGEMRRLFREGGSVKVSRSLKELARQIQNARPLLQETLSREPTVQELSEHLAVSPEAITQALCAGQPTLSLSGAEEGGWDIPVPHGEEEICDRQALRQSLAQLPKEDRELIRLRYYKGCTQTVTAQALGMTQVQVSRRERAILTRLRQGLL
ncbi:MAG: sigma-70 family RNA polymerase sigma factor [Clostridia bacterium]|nr:sigma-70 family RNA polymerase sigma factor [Clostridia bacterium]